MRDTYRENPVVEKYDKIEINESYPEKNTKEINQLLHETWSRGFKYEAYTQFSEKAFEGKFVNVSDAGIRSNGTHQVWPPDKNNLNIFVFGGSTTFGYGVTDNETIPSRLQYHLSKFNKKIVVYNFGRGFYYSTQEKILLELLISQNIKCDIAIFLDGLNEFIHLEDEPIYTYHLKEIFLKDEASKSMNLFNEFISESSYGRAQRFLNKFLNKSHKRINSLNDNKVLNPNTGYFLNRYFFNKKNIKSLAKIYGINCLFVWQPIPSYKYNQSYHPFAKNGYGIHQYSSNAYSEFKNKHLNDQNQQDFLWLGDIQENLNKRLYVDIVHYTAFFNNLISKRISDHLSSDMILNKSL